ncbi:hypothetical protein KIN20_018546 [Parelaphostrongylus tenuis]|uniref:Uncharacterized protein n=1 Tax=Parelaphostrongylus tenuis TaxID=148309 RepID=A0AAD5N167_PARTN|nr:hypothetical protein KIN20_018546 [Parelaphostrongylus tenuis]
MAQWWNTSRTGYGLINLTPHWDDRPQIPFLMMANANTKKLGCAFTVCNATDFSEYEFAQHLFPHLLKASHFVSFVCAYGPPSHSFGLKAPHFQLTNTKMSLNFTAFQSAKSKGTTLVLKSGPVTNNH